MSVEDDGLCDSCPRGCDAEILRLRGAIQAAAAILRMEARLPSGRDKTALLRAADDLEATARGEGVD